MWYSDREGRIGFLVVQDYEADFKMRLNPWNLQGGLKAFEERLVPDVAIEGVPGVRESTDLSGLRCDNT
jgi:hypothetical protein